MPIITMRITTRSDSLAGFNRWLSEWLDDFLIEDYDGIALSTPEHTRGIVHLDIPLDQIRAGNFHKLVLFKAVDLDSRLYPDTTDSDIYRIVYIRHYRS